ALFREGYVLGTVDYLAPELCGPEPGADQASDLFSLGVSMFEMLTGRLPYPRGSIEHTIRRHYCDPPTNIQRYVPYLPPALVSLVHRLLAHRPADRPRLTAVVQQLIALEIGAMRRRMSA